VGIINAYLGTLAALDEIIKAEALLGGKDKPISDDETKINRSIANLEFLVNQMQEIGQGETSNFATLLAATS
jgi:hypothetical protein